jgi:hypothetical protein
VGTNLNSPLRLQSLFSFCFVRHDDHDQKKIVTNLLEKLSCFNSASRYSSENLIQQVSFFKVETLGCFQFLKGQILVSLLHSRKKGMQALLGLVARLGTLLNLQGPLHGPPSWFVRTS